jgi:hypothetical protein
MAEAPHPQGTPRRPAKEYEDPHFHDDDEVAQPPAEDGQRPAAPAQPTARPSRKLPPPKRRFQDD